MASKPKVISKTGAIPPTATVIIVIAFLTPDDRLENFSNIPLTNSIIGVTASRNACPTGTSAVFKFSTAALNLFIEDSAVIPSSCSAIVARSAVEAVAKSKTRDAWFPVFVTFSNNVDKRANWNLPNNCSIALCLLRLDKLSKA